MKIVFMGTPEIAIPFFRKLLENGHEIRLVISQPDKPVGRGMKIIPTPVKEFALKNNIPVYQPLKIREDEKALEKIKEVNPELIVVVAYGQIIPPSIIYYPPFGAINVHFSLLPKYRGAAPVQWAILNGERKTGVTIFKLNEKMDEGDILSQREIEILPDEKASHLENRLSEIGAELLVETISLLKQGKIKPKKQDHSLATYAPRLKKENGIIDWKKDSNIIHRMVRAFDVWPSAYFFMKNKRIKIIEGKAVEPFSDVSDLLPGQIWKIDKNGIYIVCGNSTLFLIEKLQPEGKGIMSAYSFSLGARLKPGDKI
ncbi:methionyl-tRNA formyltransferase [SCandidatus Aminicenantes bacterium Aminicenantia_JdfR_composite]|jgi:methionyl-tRNA formyltransferase|nr:methionyl-tRNA formyltransferase [SCandidatus Aminicenantes bacterium Aminicenantia_JdfR_composite]MCP2597586.1 methionyl-tRNA formyltransferase [Candidatus Aminicenantes bacterium AC-335-G13]MCP2620721.1 methionyl-tRNA formyltransferase [Candidatus Aminicenantes bacterium AC-334-E05]